MLEELSKAMKVVPSALPRTLTVVEDQQSPRGHPWQELKQHKEGVKVSCECNNEEGADEADENGDVPQVWGEGEVGVKKETWG